MRRLRRVAADVIDTEGGPSYQEKEYSGKTILADRSNVQQSQLEVGVAVMTPEISALPTAVSHSYRPAKKYEFND